MDCCVSIQWHVFFMVDHQWFWERGLSIPTFMCSPWGVIRKFSSVVLSDIYIYHRVAPLHTNTCLQRHSSEVVLPQVLCTHFSPPKKLLHMCVPTPSIRKQRARLKKSYVFTAKAWIHLPKSPLTWTSYLCQGNEDEQGLFFFTIVFSLSSGTFGHMQVLPLIQEHGTTSISFRPTKSTIAYAIWKK